MKIKYIEFIDQNFDFPQEDFSVNDNELQFHGINIMDVINKYGTPLKFTYLPQISNNIQRVKTWFSEAFKKIKYTGMYHYCYCTKSSHFKFVLDEALKNDIHLETSSSIDMDIIENLINEGKIQKSNYILCNGFKRDQYILNIANVIGKGFYNCIPIIDNYKELKLLNEQIDSNFKIGIRIASEEDPKFEFYTSRLGIGYKDIIPFYNDMVKNNSKIELKMLHFFINTGIRDTSYYWNELSKCLNVYTSLKKICPTLDSLNIGGGFPIKNSLSFDFDYKYLIEEIVNQIDLVCKTENVSPPNIFTEFGSFTVGESGASIYEVLYQKQQNDREKWNIINSSFITTLPDSWAISKRFIMLPINRWDEQYERVLLGGITCDSDDYYNSEQHMNAIYLPKFDERKPLYIGFFNTGAYQENIGGFGGLQHCLIHNPKHILIQKDSSGNINYHLFKAQQSKEEFLKILGYE